VSSAAHKERQPASSSYINHRRYVLDVLGSYDGGWVANPDREVWGTCLVITLMPGLST
jgi:hypothetical protein